MTRRLSVANLRSASRSHAKSGAHLAFLGALALMSLAPSGALGTSPTPAAPGAAQPRRAAYATMVAGDYAVVGAQWQRGYQGAAFVLARGRKGWAQSQALAPTGLGRHDHFGGAVAIHGNTIVVGARWHDGLRGAAYVFQRRGDRWVEQQKLTIPDAAPDTRFGETVAIDGNLITVGARSGVVHTFRRSGDRWIEQAAAGAQGSRVAVPTAATEDVQAVTALVERAAGTPPGLPLAVTDTLDWVVATDGAYEDRTEITWRNPAPRGDILYKVMRGAEVLSYLSSEDSLFNDRTGTRGVPYAYCVSIVDMNDSEGPSKCDDGHRVVRAPGLFSASDGQSVHHVALSWDDRSAIEASYQIKRDSSLIATVAANRRFYQDSTAVTGTTYTYEVIAVDSTGNPSAAASDLGFRGFFPPPDLVTASDGEYPDRVVVAWSDTTTNQLGYDVFRNGALIATLAGFDTTYTDSTGIPDVTSEYCVEAFGPGGLRSIAVCDSGGTFLPPPRNVSATDSTLDDRVRITWEDPSGLASQYVISRFSVPQDTIPASVTRYDDRTAEAGVVYEYCVTAITGFGGVSSSACDTGSRSAVLAPTDVAVTDGTYEHRVEVTWRSTSVMAVLFKVFRDGVFIKSVGANARSYVDAAGTAGRRYEYSVRATTSLNVSSATVSDSGYRQLRTPAPVGASDGADEDRVLVSWTDASEVEDGYAIYRRSPGGDSTVIGRTGPGVVSFTDRTGVPGIHYTYSVAAFDSVGATVGESAHAGDEGWRELLAPSSVEASDSEFETTVEITWNDNSNAEDGYHVYRDTTLIGTLPDNATSFTDNSAPFDLTTTYRVAAFDAFGESAATADTGSTTILAPASFNASDAYPDSVRLKWVDRSAIEDGYRVYRDGALVATLEANGTHFTDPASPAVGVTYDYEVEAFRDDVASTRVGDTGALLGSSPTSSIETEGTLRLTPVDVSDGDGFGRTVAVGGSVAVVGAPGGPSGGAAYTFARQPDGTWAKTGRLAATVAPQTSESFGASVAINEDWVIVGAPEFEIHEAPVGDDIMGRVFSFRRQSDGTWAQAFVLSNPECRVDEEENFDRFGTSVSISGRDLVVSSFYSRSGPDCGNSSGSGRLYFYTANPGSGTWTPSVTVNAPPGFLSGFGRIVGISGDRFAVGGNTQVATYYRSGGGWVFESIFSEVLGEFGFAVAIDGDLIIAGAPGDESGTGAACIYRHQPNNTWAREATLRASDGAVGNRFGSSVSIAGDIAIVGAPHPFVNGPSGSIYVFHRNADGTWSEARKIVQSGGASQDQFGGAVAIAGDRAVAGAHDADDRGLGSGSASMIYVVAPPRQVMASDGTPDNRVEVRWEDASTDESGFHIYRDGLLIGSAGSDIESHIDYTAQAGRTHMYEVSAHNDLSRYESPRTSDFGWRPANGTITGRITSAGGGGVEGVAVRLEPSRGRSLLFDGAGGHVSIPHDAAFDFRKDSTFTIETWFRYSGHDRAPRLISKMPATATGPRPFDVGFQTLTGRLYFLMSDGANTARVMTARDSLNDDRWHHVACVNDAAQLLIYVDGALEGSVTKPGLLGNVTNTSDIVLGGLGADSWLGGQLDEIRIWRVARTAAQVASNQDRPLTGQETGLVGYWPADGDDEPVITNRARSRVNYGVLEGGVYWSTDIAPIDDSATTDGEGAFAIGGIRYGETGNFKVRPFLGDHAFDPAAEPITLTAASTVWNSVSFLDVTTYTVAGRVRFKGTEGCFASGVRISVDGNSRPSVVTDKNGKFAVAVSEGRHSIRAALEGRTITALPYPSAIVVGDSMRFDHIETDLYGLEFEDRTTHVVSGKAGGIGDRAIGRITVSVRSEDGCLGRNAVVRGAGGGYAFDLPPQKYFISATVDSLEPALVAQGLRPDILQFFQTLGEREVDLTTTADTTLAFVYQPPLAVTIDGFNSSAYLACSRLRLEDGTPLPADLPVIPQLTQIAYTVSVEAVYTPTDRVPVDSAVVVIRDEISDSENEPDTLYVRPGGDGRVASATLALTPSVIRGRTEGLANRSYQKAFTATAFVEGRAPVSRTEWVLVTGHVQKPGADFITLKGEEEPLFVLRDPPGDGSYGVLQRGTESRKLMEHDQSLSLFSGEVGVDVEFGLRWQLIKGYATPAGIFLGTGDDMGSTLRLHLAAGYRRESGREFTMEQVVSVLERFATTSNDDPTGDARTQTGSAGDIFVGMGVNYVFARTDKIDVAGDCTVRQSSGVGFEPDSIRTTFTYTGRHIASVLIPELEQRRANAAAGLDTLDEDHLSIARFDLEIARWKAMLEDEDALRRARRAPQAITNRSFSAGSEYEFTSETSTVTHEESFVRNFLYGEGEVGGLTQLFGQSVEPYIQLKGERLVSVSLTDTTGTASRSVGYLLSDDDVGDYFSVDVWPDTIHGMPVFAVRGGRSSCPYEPWPEADGPTMVARDAPRLLIGQGGSQHSVPADRPAVFTLSIANVSDESRDYVVRLLSNSNPGGADVRINGSPAGAGVLFTIDGLGPGQQNVHDATLSVSRGPRRFSYPDLKLVVNPACLDDRAVADTLSFSVSFEGCSDIRLAGPRVEPGWAYNQEDATDDDASPEVDTRELDLVLDRYELDVDPVTQMIKLEKIGAEYRYLGVAGDEPGAWKPLRNVSGDTEIDYGVFDHIFDSSPDTTTRWVPDPSLADGVYELRAFTKCLDSDARGYSEPHRGTIDRLAPEVFGTPEPGDGQLSLGEDIRIAFNEPIRCGLVDTSDVSLTYLDGPDAGDRIPIRVTCSGSALVITPLAASSGLEGRRLRATVAEARILFPLPNHGIFDLVGNPMTGSVSWEFEWRKSQFAWTHGRIDENVPLGVGTTITAELANGKPYAIDYSLPNLPGLASYLSVSPSDATGRIPPGATRVIPFTVNPALASDVYELEVEARADSVGVQVGTDVLRVYLDVACVPPTWTFATSDFEYSMSIVGKVRIDSVPISATTMRLAAFVGNELRGVASPQPPGTDPVLYLTVFSNRRGGETVRFEVWDDAQCKRYPATAERVSFMADSILGRPGNPMEFNALESAPSLGRFALSQGWNWFSTHVQNGAPGGMNVENVLSALTPSAGDVIKSKTAFAVFDPDTAVGWVGSLATLDNVQSYMIRLSTPGEILQEGAPVEPALLDIPVVIGWNWIPYARSAPQSFRIALSNLAPILGEGDLFRSQNGFARYETSPPAWLGDDITMVPGQGYRLLIHGSGGTFRYPANGVPTIPSSAPLATAESAEPPLGRGPLVFGAGAGTGFRRATHAIAASASAGPAGDRETAADPPLTNLKGWQCESSRYPGNMTVIAALRTDGAERRGGDALIGAFVGDECRGVARMTYVKGLDRHLAFLTVHGDGASPGTVTFRMLDPATERVSDIVETVPYDADAGSGTLREPLALNTATARDVVPRTFRLAQGQPNPFSLQSTLRFDLPQASHVELAIYNVHGQRVRELVNRHFAPGSHSVVWDGTTSARIAAPSGVYFYKLKAGSFTDTKTLVLIK